MVQVLFQPHTISSPERKLQVSNVLYFPKTPPERYLQVCNFMFRGTVFSPVAEVTVVAKLPETGCLPVATGNRTPRT